MSTSFEIIDKWRKRGKLISSINAAVSSFIALLENLQKEKLEEVDKSLEETWNSLLNEIRRDL